MHDDDEQPEWEDRQDAKDREREANRDKAERIAMAATERRAVWTDMAMASLHAGRHAAEATAFADTVLQAFDAMFPSVLLAAESKASAGSNP